MVQLHVKRGEESIFVLDTTVDVSLETLIQQVAAIHNGILKVDRISSGNYVDTLRFLNFISLVSQVDSMLPSLCSLGVCVR